MEQSRLGESRSLFSLSPTETQKLGETGVPGCRRYVSPLLGLGTKGGSEQGIGIGSEEEE